ncbi:MAG: glycoside hydrolase 100 family protein [Nanoarchaeota archaeon]
MEQIIDECFEKANEVIENCSTENGLFASGGTNGYDAVWSRDSNISFLGASLVKNKLFKKTFRKSLVLLGENQSEKGQIPNCVDKFSERKPHVDFKSIDSTLWFIIGHYIYKSRYRDASLFNKHKNKIKKALVWLSYQDSSENKMLEQLPTTDWQDAFPHKYGYTINSQALYYKVLMLSKKKEDAKILKKNTNENIDVGLWISDFYVPYRWKNHGKYLEIGEWFDSLGNILAIIFGLADKKQSEKILFYIKKNKIAEPYPIKAIYPPITEKSKDWQDYYKDCAAGKPNSYLNGGIWTYIGCFYVCALVKMKQFKEAEEQLEKIANANLRGNFPEWIHPKTKKNFGKLQAWDAGAYILAYESLKRKKVLL